MRIGIVHTAYLQRGGEDVAVEQECFFLKERQHEVMIMLFKNPQGTLAKTLAFLISVFNPNSWRRISKWIRKEHPDVIHIHNWHFGASPSVFHAAKKEGIPVVHTLHNYRLLCPSATLMDRDQLFLESLQVSFPWSAIFKRVYHHSFFQTFWLSFTVWFHRISGTWKSVDKYIVLTEAARELFLSSGIALRTDQLAIKPNFIPDIPLDEVQRGDDFLFVGRLTKEKGLDVLLAAFSESPFRLTIIGGGPLEAVVKEEVRRHPNIRYEGFRDRDFILAASRRCSAMIFPSIWYEGNPITIIEAFACGTPIITSRMGAMATMISDGIDGLHFEPGNATDLKIKIERWQSFTPEMKAEYGRHARQTYQQQYTPEKNMDSLIAIYEQVTKKK